VLTSRERVLKALNHEEADRIPIDLGSHASSTIAALAYFKLREKLGVTEGLPRMYNTWGQQCDVEMEVVEKLGLDVIPLHRLHTALGIPNDNEENWKEWTMAGGNKCLVPPDFNPQKNEEGDWEWYENGKMIAKMPGEQTHGFTLFYAPMEGEPTREKLDALLDGDNRNFVARIRMTDREEQYLAKEAKRLYETTDKAILFQFTGTVLENAQGVFGWDEFFVRCLTDPDLVHYFLGRLTDLHIDALERSLKHVGKYIHVIQFGDDIGAQNAPLCDPDLYREVLLPYHKKLFMYVRENYPNVHVMLHCDGDVYEIFPDLIDAGLQIFNPLQTDAAEMDPVRIKREFGKHLTWWGAGADTHGIMARGTTTQLREDIRRRIMVLAPGGGFVFNQIHNVLPEVSPEMVIAMIDAAKEFGTYPIEVDGTSEELEARYRDYWRDCIAAIRAEGIA
jgi:uroporphyrinogen decarboxylase